MNEAYVAFITNCYSMAFGFIVEGCQLYDVLCASHTVALLIIELQSIHKKKLTKYWNSNYYNNIQNRITELV